MLLPGFRALPVPITQLNLELVLKCGQSFRWRAVKAEENDQWFPEWRLTLRDRVICLRQNSDTLFYRALFPIGTHEPQDESTLAWVRDYFQLDVDLDNIFSSIDDPIFKHATSHFGGGIRILRQDPWENLVSFVCSSNNNISRITSMVQKLCTHFSSPLLFDSPAIVEPYCPFPPPHSLANLSVDGALRSLGFGYRAKYIQQTAAILCQTHEDPQQWLLSLRSKSTEEGREELLKLPGVGPKVADCILLMSCDKTEVVPIDTHMLQIAIKRYNFRLSGNTKGKIPSVTPRSREEVSLMFRKMWGSHAGWAHGVLFAADLKPLAAYDRVPTDSLLPPGSSRTLESVGLPKKARRAVIGMSNPSTSSSLSGELYAVEMVHGDSLAERIKLRRRPSRFKP